MRFVFSGNRAGWLDLQAGGGKTRDDQRETPDCLLLSQTSSAQSGFFLEAPTTLLTTQTRTQSRIDQSLGRTAGHQS